MIKIIRTDEYEHWLIVQSAKIQALIESRVFRLEHYNHFGEYRHLGRGLIELKWKLGLRIYFCQLNNSIILLIYGGNKNEQKKDIKKARNILEKYTN